MFKIDFLNDRLSTMATDEEQVKILFNLSLVNDSSSKVLDYSSEQCHESFNIENHHVPDVLNEFADIVDTKVFSQPFSLRKYKNLIPRAKNKRKSPQKQQPRQINACKIDYTPTKSFDGSPCSPTVSVDSAVDLSEDKNDVDYPMCMMDVELENHKRCTSDIIDLQSGMEFPSFHSRVNNLFPVKDTIEISNSRKRKLVEESEMIQVSAKKSKFEAHHCQSLFDILCSSLSTEIPIYVIRTGGKEDASHEDCKPSSCAHDDTTTLVSCKIDFETVRENVKRIIADESRCLSFFDEFDFDETIPVIKTCSDQSQSFPSDFTETKCSQTCGLKDVICTDSVPININSKENFTDTLFNLVCLENDSGNVNIDSQTDECKTESAFSKPDENFQELDETQKASTFSNKCEDANLSDSEHKGKLLELITLPDNVAVRTRHFIVDDDNVPDSLLKLLDSSLCLEEINSGIEAVVTNKTVEEQAKHINTCKTPYNFHVNLLRVFTAGILQKDCKDEKNMSDFKERYEKSCTNSEVCARKISNKYKNYRLKKKKKNSHTNTILGFQIESLECNQSDIKRTSQQPNMTPIIKKRFRYTKLRTSN